MSNKVTREELRKAFNAPNQNIKITNLLNALTTYIRQEEHLPHIVNNIVERLKKENNTDINTIARAWITELNKVLHDTALWEQSDGRRTIATRTLNTSGVLDLVRLHYYNKTEMTDTLKLDSEFRTRELTEQEKINNRMAKMRAAKKRKAEQRAIKERAEQIRLEQAKANQARETNKVLNSATGEVEKTSTQEELDIEYLISLNF